jgi:RNA polymerase sigma-70 factor (ECF subfamily)
MIDADLINRCREENKRAQLEMYKQCYGILMSVCFRYTKNKEDAESYLNQAFLKILTNLDKYNDEISFIAWIKRITINSIIDDFRKNKKYIEKEHQLDVFNDHFTRRVDYNQADRELDADELKNMILQLPPVTQKVFNLYVIDGYKHEEIGQLLGISEGTSKWHLSNARKNLKEMIAVSLNKENVER